MYHTIPEDSGKESAYPLFVALACLLRTACIGLSILILLLVPSLTHAFDDFHIRGKGAMTARSDFSNTGGSYRANTWGVDAGWRSFYLDYQHTEFHWRDERRIGFSDGNKPWQRLNFARMGLRLDGDLGDGDLGWFWDGGAVMGWEEELRRSFGLSGTGGLTYQFSPELSGKLGAWAIAHPALVRILPAGSLDWNMPEDYGLSLSLGFPETTFRYRTEEGFTLRAGAKAEMGESSYRLADDSHVYRKGYVTTKGVTAGVYLDAHPTDNVTATFGLEYDMERKYEIRSSSGNRKQTIDVENTPSLQFSLGLRF